MNAYCFLQFFDGLVSVCTGIFLGTGRQRIPAVANFIGYYCIGLSLSITLMFVAKLRVLGFWLGLLICVVLQSTFYIILIFKLDWEKMTDETAGGHQAEGTRCLNEDTEMVEVQVNQGLKGNRLSNTQLIFRRGLTVFAVAALFAVGASVHFLVPLPEFP